MADLLQLPKPNKERGIRRMRGCVQLPLSLVFFSFWMQMVSETSAFDWHAVLQCFYFNFRALLRGRSQTSSDVPLCAFACSNGMRVLFVCFRLWICARFSRQMTNVWTIKCLQLSYLVFLTTCSVFVCFVCVSVWHFYTRTLFLCVLEIWSHLPCNITFFVSLTEPFSRPTSFHIPSHRREGDGQIGVENINAIDSQFSLSRV